MAKNKNNKKTKPSPAKPMPATSVQDKGQLKDTLQEQLKDVLQLASIQETPRSWIAEHIHRITMEILDIIQPPKTTSNDPNVNPITPAITESQVATPVTATATAEATQTTGVTCTPGISVPRLKGFLLNPLPKLTPIDFDGFRKLMVSSSERLASESILAGQASESTTLAEQVSKPTTEHDINISRASWAAPTKSQIIQEVTTDEETDTEDEKAKKKVMQRSTCPVYQAILAQQASKISYAMANEAMITYGKRQLEHDADTYQLTKKGHEVMSRTLADYELTIRNGVPAEIKIANDEKYLWFAGVRHHLEKKPTTVIQPNDKTPDPDLAVKAWMVQVSDDPSVPYHHLLDEFLQCAKQLYGMAHKTGDTPEDIMLRRLATATMAATIPKNRIIAQTLLDTLTENKQKKKCSPQRLADRLARRQRRGSSFSSTNSSTSSCPSMLSDSVDDARNPQQAKAKAQATAISSSTSSPMPSLVTASSTKASDGDSLDFSSTSSTSGSADNSFDNHHVCSTTAEILEAQEKVDADNRRKGWVEYYDNQGPGCAYGAIEKDAITSQEFQVLRIQDRHSTYRPHVCTSTSALEKVHSDQLNEIIADLNMTVNDLANLCDQNAPPPTTGDTNEHHTEQVSDVKHSTLRRLQVRYFHKLHQVLSASEFAELGISDNNMFRTYQGGGIDNKGKMKEPTPTSAKPRFAAATTPAFPPAPDSHFADAHSDTDSPSVTPRPLKREHVESPDSPTTILQNAKDAKEADADIRKKDQRERGQDNTFSGSLKGSITRDYRSTLRTPKAQDNQSELGVDGITTSGQTITRTLRFTVMDIQPPTQAPTQYDINMLTVADKNAAYATFHGEKERRNQETKELFGTVLATPQDYALYGNIGQKKQSPRQEYSDTHLPLLPCSNCNGLHHHHEHIPQYAHCDTQYDEFHQHLSKAHSERQRYVQDAQVEFIDAFRSVGNLLPFTSADIAKAYNTLRNHPQGNSALRPITHAVEKIHNAYLKIGDRPAPVAKPAPTATTRFDPQGYGATTYASQQAHVKRKAAPPTPTTASYPQAFSRLASHINPPEAAQPSSPDEVVEGTDPFTITHHNWNRLPDETSTDNHAPPPSTWTRERNPKYFAPDGSMTQLAIIEAKRPAVRSFDDQHTWNQATLDAYVRNKVPLEHTAIAATHDRQINNRAQRAAATRQAMTLQHGDELHDDGDNNPLNITLNGMGLGVRSGVPNANALPPNANDTTEIPAHHNSDSTPDDYLSDTSSFCSTETIHIHVWPDGQEGGAEAIMALPQGPGRHILFASCVMANDRLFYSLLHDKGIADDTTIMFEGTAPLDPNVQNMITAGYAAVTHPVRSHACTTQDTAATPSSPAITSLNVQSSTPLTALNLQEVLECTKAFADDLATTALTPQTTAAIAEPKLKNDHERTPIKAAKDTTGQGHITASPASPVSMPESAINFFSTKHEPVPRDTAAVVTKTEQPDHDHQHNPPDGIPGYTEYRERLAAANPPTSPERPAKVRTATRDRVSASGVIAAQAAYKRSAMQQPGFQRPSALHSTRISTVRSPIRSRGRAQGKPGPPLSMTLRPKSTSPYRRPPSTEPTAPQQRRVPGNEASWILDIGAGKMDST